MISGFSHIGVSTHNMQATLHFYCDVLGCRLKADELVKIEGGGTIRQASIDIGREQYLVFMDAKDVESIPENYDTSINQPLGLPTGMYHYSFNVESLEILERLMNRLEEFDVDVSEIINLDYIKSIFFQDPNGLQFEASVKIRDFVSSDIGRITEAGVAS
ncbi:MAG: VOC family protein [Cognaticolwellia sp.]